MNRAQLIGKEPDRPLGYIYPAEPPYDVVVIGSLSFGQLLHFREEPALVALSQGKQVILYTPGLPEAPQNRALSAALASAKRELKNWGVIFTDGGQKRLITAETAKQMRISGKKPEPGAVMTPLAREILEGMN